MLMEIILRNMINIITKLFQMPSAFESLLVITMSFEDWLESVVFWIYNLYVRLCKSSGKEWFDFVVNGLIWIFEYILRKCISTFHSVCDWFSKQALVFPSKLNLYYAEFQLSLAKINYNLLDFQSYLGKSSYFSDIDIDFTFFGTNFAVVSIAIVATTFLLLGVNLPHTGELTRFLHKLGFMYFIYFLWWECNGRANAWFNNSQEDSLFFRLFLVYSTITVAVFFFGVAERYFLSKRASLDFPVLILFVHSGGIFALRLHTFSDLLIALESVTLASYALVSFERQNRFSTYAGVQYFIIGSLPSASLLLAFGLFYLQGGSVAIQDLDLLFNTVTSSSNFMNVVAAPTTLICEYVYPSVFTDPFDARSLLSFDWFSHFCYAGNSIDFFAMSQIESIVSSVNPINSMTLSALCFLFFNLFFKLTAAPFHVWAPSVYSKAPIASVTFLSIYQKVSVLFLLFKLLNSFLHVFSFFILGFFLLSGILSVFVGSMGAFSEKLIKRFFVYSSSGHVGFSLVGLGLTTIEGASASFNYLAVYVLSSFISWFLLLTSGRSKNHLSHFAELKTTNSLLALIFAFLVFSSSGIPPLGGFFIKLDVLAALLDSSHFFTNYLLFFFTVASFFYYLRVVKIMFFDSSYALAHARGFRRVGQAISHSNSFVAEYPRYAGRLWISVVAIILLAVYLFLVQKPLLAIQLESLASFILTILLIVLFSWYE